MDIDPTTLSTLGAGGAGSVGILWLVVRSLFGKMDGLKSELDDFRVKVAEQYVNKTSLTELEARLDKRFDRVETMLMNGHKD